MKKVFIGSKEVSEIPNNLFQGKYLGEKDQMPVLEIDGCEVVGNGDGTIDEVFKSLVNIGKIITSNTKSGIGYRTNTKLKV